MILPILHAGGFSWDEAVVLIVAVAAVPVLSWFTGRFGKRMQESSSREARRARRRAGLGDEGRVPRGGDGGDLEER